MTLRMEVSYGISNLPSLLPIGLLVGSYDFEREPRLLAIGLVEVKVHCISRIASQVHVIKL